MSDASAASVCVFGAGAIGCYLGGRLAAAGTPVTFVGRARIADAIRAYTSNAAWQDFAEGWKGSLEVGKVADFCVVDGPLLRVDAHDIPDLPIAMTVLDGVVVHDASR